MLLWFLHTRTSTIDSQGVINVRQSITVWCGTCWAPGTGTWKASIVILMAVVDPRLIPTPLNEDVARFSELQSFLDSADLRWLGDRFEDAIKVRKDELSLEYIGLAMKRIPELKFLFERPG